MRISRVVTSAVILASVALLCAAPGVLAVSAGEQAAIKQAKAGIKVELSGAAADAKQTLGVFEDDVDALLADIVAVVTPASDSPAELASLVARAIIDIYSDNAVAVNAMTDAVNQACVDANVDAPNALLSGSGGEADKARAKLDKSAAGAQKKIAAKARKFAKALPKATSGGYALNVIVQPFAPAQAVNGDKDSSAGYGILAVRLLAVVAGSSGAAGSGAVSMAGMSTDAFDLTAVIGGANSAQNAFVGLWQFTSAGLQPRQSVLVTLFATAAVFVLVDQTAIGIPAP